MFSRFLKLFLDLGLLVNNFWLGLLVMILWQLSLFPVRYWYDPAVFVSRLTWLHLSLRLFMLHWPDLESLNNSISKEGFLIVYSFSSSSWGFEWCVLSGDPVCQHKVRLFALPARFHSLTIGDPVETASLGHFHLHVRVPLFWWTPFVVQWTFV